MRLTILYGIMILLPAFGEAQQQQTIERRYAASSTASIRLTAVSQETVLRVIGWDRDSIALSGHAGANARVDGGVTSNGSGAKLFVESPVGGTAAPAQLELRVPAGARLWVKLGSGDVEVTGVRGAVDVNIVSGSIGVSGELRELNAEAMDGTITVDGRADWLRAKTAGGAVTIDGGGDDVGLTSVSGMVMLRGGPVTRARIETVTGDVVVVGAIAQRGQLTIDSHSGRVEYRLSKASGADIEVVTVNGTVTNHLTTQRPLPGMGARGQELGTSVAGGGRSITIRTFKGSVLLAADTATAAAARP